MQGQIYKIYSDSYFVNLNGNIIPCKIRDVLKKQKTSIVTGDFVEVDKDVITKVLPRKSFIKRPSVANVDQIVVVSALKEPELDFGQLNRYISLAKYYKLPVILCFNKEDLDSSDKEEVERIYKGFDAPLIFTSAKEKINIDTVKELLRGKTTAVAGPSGVGKSTLINAIVGSEIMETGDISKKTLRGKHTTRHTEMFEFDVDGTESFILDTPGFSSFYLPTLHEQERASDYYPEFLPFMSKCRFNACLHDREPDCGVKKAVEEGLISRERYENYLKIISEIKTNYRY